MNKIFFINVIILVSVSLGMGLYGLKNFITQDDYEKYPYLSKPQEEKDADNLTYVYLFL